MLSKTKPSWDDLALFAAVARAGGLTAAVAETGVSAPTLSRRMTALEARMGRRLFLHGKAGYTCTAEGRALLDRIKGMEVAAAEIDAWQAAETGPARVRISAGTWTALALVRDLGAAWTPDAPWVPEFVRCEQDMDIARREVDIGIRNRRPTQSWLAGRRVGSVHFAVYARDPDQTRWIGSTGSDATLPSQAWVAAHHGGAVSTTANDPILRHAMAQAGLGRVVLPTFIGDHDPVLTRLGEPIAALSTEQWLVAHHEARHDPPIRAALTALAKVLLRRVVSPTLDDAPRKP